MQKESSYTKRHRTGRTPTSSTSEQKVPHAGMPWETGSGEGKYSYYPGGDRSAEPKEAPSAVNVVVVPDVNLPKVRSIADFDGATSFRAEHASHSSLAQLWETPD